MKRTLVLLVALAMAAAIEARPVDMQRARSLVEAHFFTPAVCVSPQEWDEIYIFQPVDGNGFVIVSADDCTRPVLAYSLDRHFPVGEMPAHVAEWIDGYRLEIASLRKAGATASPAVQALWANPKSGGRTVIEPLVTTTWNQSPWYNNMCPYSWSESARAVTGCVATAQAQIMKYWNHPAKGYGSHNYHSENFGSLSVTLDTLYQWDMMPNALGWWSSDDEIHAVAQLMYHIGVAVEMNYGVSSSGAYVMAYQGYNLPSSERSLKEHFRYSPLLSAVWKSEFSDAEWDSLLLHELIYQRPILYSGRDSEGGHAFVLDGSDSSGFFHVNWGWGGAYDGYYTTDSLSPGAGGIGGNATYTFNLQNAALIGIHPVYGNDSIAYVNAVSADPSMGTVTGNGTYTPYVDYVEIRAVAAEGYRFAGWKSGSVTNPVRMLINGDFTDTALFIPLGRDTLAYCSNNNYTSWHDDYGNNTSWGIRIPALCRNELRSLSAVQLFVREQGFYTMSLYFGDSIVPENQIHSSQYDLTDASGWTTIAFDNPFVLVGDKPLFITFSYTSPNNSFPATASYYTGVSDGTWYRLPEGWRPYDQYGVCLTWMIRALFTPRPCRVAIENAGYCDLDSFSGAGDYALGETATVSVSDPLFSHWEGIDNTTSTITFTVTGDTTFYAYCVAVGIDEVEPVESNLPIAVYDMTGRRVATRPDEVPHLPSGVYLLRQGDAPARKIVVMR